MASVSISQQLTMYIDHLVPLEAGIGDFEWERILRDQVGFHKAPYRSGDKI